MRLRFWRCRRRALPALLPRRTPNERPALPAPLPQRVSNERPAWATAPTEAFPIDGPGRPGWLTRAQEWRANGGRWLPSPRGPEEDRH